MQGQGRGVGELVDEVPVGAQPRVEDGEVVQDAFGVGQHVVGAMAGLGEQGLGRAEPGGVEEFAQALRLGAALAGGFGDAVVGVAGDGELGEAEAVSGREVGEPLGTGEVDVGAVPGQCGSERGERPGVGLEGRADHDDAGHGVLRRGGRFAWGFR